MMYMKQIGPPLMGGLMGLMLLRMVHGIIIQDSGLAAPMLTAFVLGHFVVVGILAALVIWSTRYAPTLRAHLNKLHRPSLRHIAVMMGFAIVTALAAHIIMHGGL